MRKNNLSPRGELSYYGLSLLSYLRDAHPDKAADTAFIAARADRAREVYSEAIRSGLTHIEAEERASAELYRGLHFSAYNTLVNILWDEFSVEIPKTMPVRSPCRSYRYAVTCCKIHLTDDFADTPTLRPLPPRTAGNHSNTSGRWRGLIKRRTFAKISKR